MLNVCVIGCGRAGRIHMKSYAGGVRGANLLAVCDPMEEARASAVADFGADRAYADWHDVMADPDIDAIVVVTPTGMHRDIVVAAAAATVRRRQRPLQSQLQLRASTSSARSPWRLPSPSATR